MTKEKKDKQANSISCNIDLDPIISIPYQQLREFLPSLSEDKWLELKDIALDNRMSQFIEFTEQARRHSQVEPDFVVKIGALVNVLEKILNVFKIQRAIIEELKEAISEK